ncbi:MAG: hypothetical protein ACJASR_001888 [Psychroserpens sp.]|jgi:hypothetical protein
MHIYVVGRQTKFIPKADAFYWFLTKKVNFFNLTCFLLFYFFSLPTLAQNTNFDEVSVTLNVKDIGRIELSAVINNQKEIFLSVHEVLDFLKIKNDRKNSYKTVEGFFINPNNVFSIDKKKHTIQYKRKDIPLKPEDLISTTANLFLKASYFNSVFELENSFSFRNLSVSMSSKLELPAIRTARIQLMRDNINKIKNNFIADTTFSRDKPLFHFGVADWSINTIQQTKGTRSQRANINLGGMLAGGDFAGSFNYGTNQTFLLRNQYYNWRYVNKKNKYISEISLGKIATQSTATILNTVVGGQITNAPIQPRKYFGSYRLSDYTNPDWTVELYVNNILVDYMRADANGFYSFDVPLMYGLTEVSVRYYGPWGEEEVSGKQFTIPFYFLPKNKLEYSLSSGIIEDTKNSIFANVKVNYGFSDYITLEGGLEYVSALEKNKIIPYFGTSVRLANQLFISGGYYSKVKYTGNLNFSSSKNIRLNLDYTKFNKNQEAVRFNYSELRKMSVSSPIQTSFFSGFTRFTYQQNLSPNSIFNISELLLSGRIYKMNFNFTTNSYFTNKTKPFVVSNLSTSLRLPKGIVLIPNIRYEYNSTGINSLRVEAKKRVFKKGFLQASLNLDFKRKRHSFQIGFQYNFKFSNMAFSSNINKNTTSFSQSASGSLIFEPTGDFVKFNNRTSINRGSIKFVPFLDTNDNGKRDPNENHVTGLEVEINGGNKHVNPKQGTTVITRLEPYIEQYVTFNTTRINNIAWHLKNKTLNITLNPNQLKIVEIPFSVVGEVAGMVQYGSDGQLGGASGLKINIYKNDTVFVTSILSQPDGYFNFLGLTSGSYSAKIDSNQLQELELQVKSKNTEFIIENGTYGAIVDNLEFKIYKDDKK